jgi:excisionase family DNA binding protein
VREVAKLLSISRATVHALIDGGDLEASQIGPAAKKQRLHVRVTRKSLCGFYQKRFGHPLNRALENPFES